MCCAHGVGDGRNTMLRRSRCASPLYEAVQARLGSSMLIEEQNGTDRKHIRGSPLHSFIRHRMAFVPMMARSSFVMPYGGVDVPSCAEPDQISWRKD